MKRIFLLVLLAVGVCYAQAPGPCFVSGSLFSQGSTSPIITNTSTLCTTFTLTTSTQLAVASYVATLQGDFGSGFMTMGTCSTIPLCNVVVTGTAPNRVQVTLTTLNTTGSGYINFGISGSVPQPPAPPSGGGALTTIQDINLGGTQATISFTGIPGTFKTLEMNCNIRGDTAAQATNVNVTFNGDTGANYEWQQSTSGGTASGTAQTAMTIMAMPAASNTASFFQAATMTVPNYASTNMAKTAFVTLMERGASTPTMTVGVTGGNWTSAAAITSPVSTITLTPVAGNFVQFSRCTLYGRS